MINGKETFRMVNGAELKCEPEAPSAPIDTVAQDAKNMSVGIVQNLSRIHGFLFGSNLPGSALCTSEEPKCMRDTMEITNDLLRDALDMIDAIAEQLGCPMG